MRKADRKYFIASIAVIIFFLFYNVFLAFTSLEGTPQKLTGNPRLPYLTDKPLTEDGYYMLTVAWNIAKGNGFTYNYGIKTTGVQPLAALLYSVPAYFVQKLNGGKYLFARSIILLAAILQVVFAFIIYRLSVSISKIPNKGLYLFVSVCVVLLNFKVMLNFANGLETGLYLILLALFFLYWLKFNSVQSGIFHTTGLGILTGLILLARLDSGIILFIFYLIMLFTRRISIRQSLTIFIIAVLLFLPWQIYVWEVTGNLLQSSVRSQTTFFFLSDFSYKLEQYFVSIIHHLTPFLFTGNIKLWLMFPLGIIYISFLIYFYNKYTIPNLISSKKQIILYISISFLILVVIYFFFSTAPYFYYRYLAFCTIITFPLFVILFTQILQRLKIISRVIIVVLVFIFFVVHSVLYLHSGKSARAFTVRVEFVKSNFSDDIRIAAFQTGVLGYYCSNTFNLDGKMDNSSLVSNTRNDIEAYIDRMGINVIMEWKDFMPILLKKDYLDKYWNVYAYDIGDGRTICYIRKKIQNSEY